MTDTNRNTAVDLVRTLALVGICVVNLPWMALPVETALAPPTDGLDGAAAFAVTMLFQAKFFLLFSFVFGWGIEIQHRAAGRAGVPFSRRYGRRLAMLGALGIAHALLVFSGDILLLYALLGLAAWPLRKAPPRRLLAIAAAMVPVAFLCILGLGLVLAETPPPPPGPGLGGSYAETVAARLRDWPGTFAFLVLFQGHLAFGAFLAGIAAAKADVFEPDSAAARRLRRAGPWLLAGGLAVNLLHALAGPVGPEADLPALLGFAAIAVGGPMLAAGWLVLALWLAERWRLPGLLVLAGRNSLSAYVLQGVLAGALFGGYGLGLFGALGRAELLALSVALALAAMLAVGIFARLFGSGPLEAVLRRATYG